MEPTRQGVPEDLLKAREAADNAQIKFMEISKAFEEVSKRTRASGQELLHGEDARVVSGMQDAMRELREKSRKAARLEREWARERGGWGEKAGRIMVFAAKEQRGDMVQWLYGQGVSVTGVADGEGLTAVKYLAALGDKEVLEWLVDQGADIFAAESGNGNSLFSMALYNGHPGLARWLAHLQPGAHLKKNDDGSLLMHWVAKYNEAESMAVLLELGAGVQDADHDGNTPLHWAAREDASAAMVWLLKNGADLHAKNREGKTPLDLATPETLRWFTDWMEKQKKGKGNH